MRNNIYGNVKEIKGDIMEVKYITSKDYNKIVQKAKDKAATVPDGHCRIKAEHYNNEILDGIKLTKGRAKGKIKYVIYTRRENLGNTSHPYMITVVDVEDMERLEKETEKQLRFRWNNRVNKSKIVAYVK